MHSGRLLASVACSVALVGLVGVTMAPPVSAEEPDLRRGRNGVFRAHMSGFMEVPSVSTPASGRFMARLSPDGQSLSYSLSYSKLSGDVIFAHIHLGRARTNGGVIVFLCQTTGGADPTGLAPLCVQEGTVDGVITADNVIGPGGQGIAAGEFDELVRALRVRATYVNVHTTAFGGGEIRGNIR